jgi:cell division protein FtsA
MICETIIARLHLVDAAQTALRNLGATLARCELDVEELVSAPLAAGLATLVEDEKQVGCTLIEMGGGTTSLAVFAEGHLRHTAQLPVGGWNVTNDLARGLSTPLLNAERLKTLHGGVLGGPEDHKEMLAIQPVGEDEDRIAQVPRSMVVGIIEPRLTETFELLRDRLEHAGLANEIGPQVVLTGGASQLIGVRQLAERVLGRHVRLGRPHPVLGLPEVANGPAFAGPLGLLAWAAGEGRPLLELDPTEEKRGFLNRILNWLRDKGA